MASAKMGIGIEEILEAVVHRIPAAAEARRTKSCARLVFDSVFDIYRGVVAYVRVFSGKMEAGSSDQVDEQPTRATR